MFEGHRAASDGRETNGMRMSVDFVIESKATKLHPIRLRLKKDPLNESLERGTLLDSRRKLLKRDIVHEFGFSVPYLMDLEGFGNAEELLGAPK